MFKLDLDRVRANVGKAATADLLERVTVYRDGMEPAALDLIETELRRRGVSYQKQAEFGEAHEKGVVAIETRMKRAFADVKPLRSQCCHDNCHQARNRHLRDTGCVRSPCHRGQDECPSQRIVLKYYLPDAPQVDVHKP